MLAELQQRLVGLVLEELGVDDGTVVVEDEALGAELHRHVVEAVVADFAVADEHPLAEIGEVEVRVNEAIGQVVFVGDTALGVLDALELHVLEDEVLVSEKISTP